MSPVNGLSLYIVRQIAGPLFFFSFALTALVWLTQSLRVLDVIINQNQSAGTFIELAVLLLPGLISLVLPVSLFIAVIFALNRLQLDSELVIMWSSGFGRWAVAKPVLFLAVGVALVVYAVNLYFLPAGMRAFKDRVFAIRGDLVSVLLKEGDFSTPADGVTVFVRETEPNGDIRNILVHDTRNPGQPVTYIANHGRIARTPEGPRLVMWDGTVQRTTKDGNVALLDFDRYTFDLQQFGSDMGDQIRDTSERYLHELLFPDPTSYWDSRYWNRLIAEGHARLTGPLYAIALTMIALVALVSGDFARRGYAKRIAMATLLGLLIRLGGVGLQSAAAKVPLVNLAQYLLPLGTMMLAATMLDGRLPRPRLLRRRPKLAG